jgi:hypothetical protein
MRLEVVCRLGHPISDGSHLRRFEMEISSDDRDFRTMLSNVITTEAQSPMSIKTVGGETVEAYEPITLGLDYIIFRTGSTAQNRRMTVRFAAIASLMI